MPRPSTRLDKLLVDRGMTASRQRAEALILAAKVLVDGVPVTKAGKLVSAASALEIVAPDHPYVSRGGVKLEHALAAFSVPVAAQVAMDVGASTGGFTDCLLQFGARRVYAVDVGYGQLAWKLRRDPRVVAIERQNIRSLNRSQVPEAIQLATVDVSFISLKLAIPPMIAFLAPGAYLVALIKPQFEAGRENVGKGGVVRDPGTQERVCDDLLHWSRSCGLAPLGITPSPLLGPKGNREFLLAARVTS